MINTSAIERNVYCRSGSLKLSAVLRIPDGMQPGESRLAYRILFPSKLVGALIIAKHPMETR